MHMTLSEIEDELAIRKVLAEYALRLELDDFETWLDLFTPDCTYEIFRRTLRGRDEVRAMLSQAPEGIHLSGSPRIELDGERARAVQNYIFINGKTREMTMGWYFHELTKSDSGWRIHALQLKFHK
jgi:SnoaL-like domain